MRRGLVVTTVWAVATVGLAAAVWSASAPALGTGDGVASPWPAIVGTAAVAAAAVLALALRRDGAAVALALVTLTWWTLSDNARGRSSEWVATTMEVGSLLVLPLLAGATLLLLVDHGRARRPLRIGLGLLAAATVVVVTQADPFTDPDCWRNCVPNALSAWSADGTQRLLRRTLPVLQLAWAVIVIQTAAWTLSTRRRRRTSLDGVATAVLCLAFAGVASCLVYGLVSIAVNPGAVSADRSVPGHVVASILAVGLAGALLTVKVAHDRARAELGRLVGSMADIASPEGLQSAFAHALDDPGLTIRYWLAPRHHWIDGDGRSSPVHGAADLVTMIVRNAEPIAALHTSRPMEVDQVDGWIGPALRLCLENAGLVAASRAELRELTASRERMVERADAERAALERDLHDGAQQRVVGLLLRLGMVRDATDPGAAEHVGAQRLVATAKSLLAELRAVARGLHPPVLDEAGLEAAIHELADTHPSLLVGVRVAVPTRPEHRVESGVYRVVDSVLSYAAEHGATRVDVGVAIAGTDLRVDIDGDGPTAPPDLLLDQVVIDRVAVLGGSIDVATDVHRPGRWTVRMELPCAS